MNESGTYGRVPPRALAISAAALAIPVAVTLLARGDLGTQQPLLWLLALVPAFLLAYYRGWRGAAVAIAGGMAALAVTHGIALWLGRPLPDSALVLAVIPIFLGISFGIGWTTELLHRRFSLAQESAMELTLVVSAAGVIRYASPSVRDVLGYDRSKLEGVRLERILERGSAADFLSRLDGLRDGDALEIRLQREAGDVRVLEVLVQDRRDTPSLLGFVFRARDITDRRSAEEQARRVARMQAIGALAGPLAHDFNNALTAIQGNADLLRDDLQGNATALQGLLHIEQAAERAARTVEMLLAFTRQQVLRPRPVAPAAILEDTRPRLEELLGPSIDLTVRVAEAVPDVSFDAVRLRQILLLLAARAREVMPAGGRFGVEAEAAEITAVEAASFPYPVSPGDYVLLVVRDSGPALSAGEVALVFEPFAVTVGADATGLELSSVYGTIKQAGGYVWVESGPDGTAFRMYLPLAVAPLPLLHGPQAEERPGRTVLVVEDDVSVRAVVCQALLRRGYYVVEAQDGEEALQVVAAMGTLPDALITDLVMPKLGGRDLARELTDRYGAFPILYISGFTQDAVMAESTLRPGETLLSKPFSAQRLAETLRDLLDDVAP